MKWSAVSEADIWEMINNSWGRMSLEQRRLWEVIKIPPEKWAQHPWGDQGEGFWVVAIIGSSVVWYNDIEEGFNQSLYTSLGEIDEYWCNQDELEHSIQNILDQVQTGLAPQGKFGPPS